MEAASGRQRISYIDGAKGAAMLLVIIGHTVEDGWAKGLIYSFHIPLFFICSGMTFRFSADLGDWRVKAGKGVRRLLVPALALYLLTAALSVWLDGGFETTRAAGGVVKKRMLTLLWFSGNDVRIGDDSIGAVGVIWFLGALFLARCLWDLIHLYAPKLQGILSFAAAVCGVLLGGRFWMPLSFDVALAGIGFLEIGYRMRGHVSAERQRPHIAVFLGSGTVWLFGVCCSALAGRGWFDMAMRSYPLFPLCYLTAAAGTVFVFCIASAWSRWDAVSGVFAFAGRNSIVLLFVHYMAYLPYLLYAARVSGQAARCMLRLAVELGIFAVVTAAGERRRRIDGSRN